MSDKYANEPGRGVLFRNRFKEENEKRPDFVGSLNVDGVDYELAAWQNTSKNGVKYLSLRLGDEVKEKEAEKKDEEVPF
jgi:uncharacterized protein (DUF736 family)|tara:strand:+ start:23198 stop:23434 length:237 start_codon:yes stop_codon:yes gene_type:complete